MISDAADEVVYVGQSRNLRKRISSHSVGDVFSSAVAQGVYEGHTFTDYPTMTERARELMEGYSVCWVITGDRDSMERSLIAEHQPRYNRDK
jgi:excinuclease UvrABC nuclease subunit